MIAREVPMTDACGREAEGRAASLGGWLPCTRTKGHDGPCVHREGVGGERALLAKLDEKQAVIEILGSAIGRLLPDFRAPDSPIDHALAVARALDSFRESQDRPRTASEVAKLIEARVALGGTREARQQVLEELAGALGLEYDPNPCFRFSKVDR